MFKRLGSHDSRCIVRAAIPAALSLIGVSISASAAVAQTVEQFYSKNRINLVIGSPPGASYDAYGRLLARHYGDHIPGSPEIVVLNKPGAGGLAAANGLYNDPRKDGATLAMLGQSTYFMQLLGVPNIEYDATKFTWIGRMTNVIDVVVAWHTAKAKTMDDAFNVPVSVAVGGALSGSTLYVNFMNAMLGTKFVPTKGYASAEAFLAMERGEVDATGSANWYGLQAQHNDKLRDRKLVVLVQIGLEKAPGLEHVPLFPELAKTERDRKILVALATTDEIARTVSAPPGVPETRVRALRVAFMATMKSEGFISDAKKARMALNPMDGEALTKLVIDSGSGLSPDMIADIKKMADK